MRKISADLALILLALAGYCLPWVVSTGASMTMNAYDLAEWSSLHPDVRASAPTLLTTFALRVLLVCIGTVIVFSPTLVSRWLRVALALLIAAALLPPFEFFSAGLNDPNYRQQFSLSVAMLGVGAIALINRLMRLRVFVQLAALGVGLILSIGAIMSSYSLLAGFDLARQIGSGVIIFVVSVVVCGVVVIKRGNFA
ncbi:MAG: hypothetical protein CL610_09565 [Anaerolineaceae bacterium]|nr:hypothetical protein [Anaerolineaceae bacterium]